MNDKNNKKDTDFVRTNCYLQKTQINWLKGYKKQTGTSGAELLRRLLNDFIKKQEKTRISSLE